MKKALAIGIAIAIGIGAIGIYPSIAQQTGSTPENKTTSSPITKKDDDPLNCGTLFSYNNQNDYRTSQRMVRSMPPTPMANTMVEISASAGAPVTADMAMSPPPPPPPQPPPALSVSKIAATPSPSMPVHEPYNPPVPNTENYASITDNPVHRASEIPVSTFSIDVDTGSYSNVRRMLNQGTRPPADAVRVEEMLNYFDYSHPVPTNLNQPFKVTTELAPAPWNAERQLLMIGIKGYDVPKHQLPASNLVFLVDTSGSMMSPDKLPLLQESICRMLPQLRKEDRISLVAYAGSAGLVLAPTAGNQHKKIIAALQSLQAGGSTNGGEGIQLAYKMAKESFIKNGINRVILGSDGDFNVGIFNQQALETYVADQRKSGISLTTLGFGTGNYNDEMAERLADVGNGNYAYIDNIREARKVLIDQIQSTLLTIANDVKIQIEFNPNLVSEYRLIGYENRLLNREDFNNDAVDAGDIGAGHQVTALYEITPAGSSAQRLPALRYSAETAANNNNQTEMAFLRLRYKLPDSDTSKLIETPISKSSLTKKPSETLLFASSVAGYADLLRGGKYMDGWSWDNVYKTANSAKGNDPYGFRQEFVELIKLAQQKTTP